MICSAATGEIFLPSNNTSCTNWDTVNRRMIESTCDSLKNQFLIATPQLSDGLFKASVTYICEHNASGAMGIIINRPSNISLAEILSDLVEQPNEFFSSDQPVMVGGPVGMERGFVLHQTFGELSLWESSLQVTDDIALTGSKDILIALGKGEGPANYLVALGYAGWEAGQLEQELADNAWITSPANADILFSTPYHHRAKAAAALLGIDLNALSTQSGHA